MAGLHGPVNGSLNLAEAVHWQANRHRFYSQRAERLSGPLSVNVLGQASFTQIRISPSPRFAQQNQGINVNVWLCGAAGARS